MKTLFTIILSFILFNTANAQSDTLIYYMRAGAESYDVLHFNNVVIADSSNAEFVRFIISPTSDGDGLYIIKDFDFDGKLKLMGESLLPAALPKFEGVCVEYFTNGHKKTICNYHNGELTGDLISYFPNGHPNTVKSYENADTIKSNMFVVLQIPHLKQCLDSAGNILADNGNGKWIEFHNNYKAVYAEGTMVNGVEEGEWHGRLNDTLSYSCTYMKGKLMSGKSISVSGKEYKFTKVYVPVESEGGGEKFAGYLGHTIKYPADARAQHKQGKVWVSFIVTKDGSITSVAVNKGVFPSLDIEARNAIANSSGWIPAFLYGMPVKTSFNLPISFTLEED